MNNKLIVSVQSIFGDRYDMEAIAHAVFCALVKADAEHQDYYQARFSAYIKALPANDNPKTNKQG